MTQLLSATAYCHQSRYSTFKVLCRRVAPASVCQVSIAGAVDWLPLGSQSTNKSMPSLLLLGDVAAENLVGAHIVKISELLQKAQGHLLGFLGVKNRLLSHAQSYSDLTPCNSPALSDFPKHATPLLLEFEY